MSHLWVFIFRHCAMCKHCRTKSVCECENMKVCSVSVCTVDGDTKWWGWPALKTGRAKIKW